MGWYSFDQLCNCLVQAASAKATLASLALRLETLESAGRDGGGQRQWAQVQSDQVEMVTCVQDQGPHPWELTTPRASSPPDFSPPSVGTIRRYRENNPKVAVIPSH